MDNSARSRGPFFIPALIIGLGIVIGAIALVIRDQSGGSTDGGTSGGRLDVYYYARTLALDEAAFGACMNSEEASDEIDNDIRDAASYGLSSTPSFFINGQLLKGAHDFDKFAEVIDAELAGSTPAGERTDVSVDDDPVLGSFGAKVTVIEFSDYECPYCARFHRDTFGRIKEAYIDTGKIKYVFRDLPLASLHPDAIELAKVAYCAGEQGKFWEMNDLLFTEQENRHGTS